MTPFAVAGLQTRVSASESNLPRLASKLDDMMTVYPWVQMVLFSELAAHGPSTAHAEPLPGPSEASFRAMARKHGVWLLTGSVFERAADGVYNTAQVIDPHGVVIGKYRKLFPFRPYEAGVEAGDSFFVFDVPDVGRFGVSICYDMWFPETSRTLAALGAEVILHPTLTNSIDRDVELAIARATAAQNQCFFFDVNGLDDGGNGQSIVVGPHGDVLHQAGASEEWIALEIDLEQVRRSRAVGLRTLGQPLKSFRDRKVDFTVYERGSVGHAYLDSLGPLEMPHRGSRAGIR